MKLALATVCPDARQQALLDTVWPSWEAFAKRHGVPIRVIEESPVPDAPYWGKYFSLTLPELRGFDAVLAVDNDVVISPDAPLPSEGWDGLRVRCVDERAQFAHDDARFARYYSDYDLAPPAGGRPPVLNTGVLLYTRDHAAWFATLQRDWRIWRDEFRARHGAAADPFRAANDQPHVSHALQRADRFELIDVRFNRLWWSWWEDGGRRQELPLKLYAKSVQLLGRILPRGLVRPLAHRGRAWWNEALRENHFMHVAGSKSPIALYDLGA